MKIVGFTYLDGRAEMVLRCDSCLLNGGKPYFLPEEGGDIRATRCVVLRVSRLGKGIRAKFAERYFDAWAPGLDIINYTDLAQAREQGRSWTSAIAGDYSLPVGEWNENENANENVNANENDNVNANRLCIPISEAIERISHVMTIRQGDLIYIDYAEDATPLQRECVLSEEGLYCKIK